MADVLIPFSGECGWRRKALGWLLDRLDGNVIVGSCLDPWRKALAVQDAFRRSRADVLVIHDADVWCDYQPAVDAVANGAAWAMPHQYVHRLNAEATEQVYAGVAPAATRGRDQRPYRGYWGGGIIVLRRDVWEATPIDARFEGWGQEDRAWSLALLGRHGKGQRFDAPLHHLWHPHPERLSRRVGSQRSRQLERRYQDGYRNPDRLAVLIEEAKEAMWTPQG